MNNPYRAYWEKAQEQSLKLAQYYTPECLVELCIALLQPKGELFDPCCGLGSFLLKAKEKNPNLKINGNDVAQDLGELPFEFTNSDYLNNGIAKQFDYTIANIPFNSKKTHCNLVDENYCWIEKIKKYMNEINKQIKNKTLLGSHCFLLGTDVWQLGNQKEQIQKLFPNNPKLEKLIQIAQILDKYQKEINYYQSRIRGILEEISKIK